MTVRHKNYYYWPKSVLYPSLPNVKQLFQALVSNMKSFWKLAKKIRREVLVHNWEFTRYFRNFSSSNILLTFLKCILLDL